MTREKNTSNTIGTFWSNFKTGLIVKGLLVGLISGFIIVGYRYILEVAFATSKNIHKFVLETPKVIPIWLIIIMIIGFLISVICEKHPMIKGGGVAQTEAVLLRGKSHNWIYIIVGKIISTALGFLGGLSLGRGGPSIQIGAAAGQGISKILKRPKIEEKILMTAGMSAGLSATFNTPIASILFVLEEVHKNFSQVVVIPASIAAVTSDMVSRMFFGQDTLFSFSGGKFTTTILLLGGVLGVVTGIYGVLFNICAIRLVRFMNKVKFIPPKVRMILPFLVAGISGLLLIDVTGGGQGLVTSSLSNSYMFKTLIILFVGKFILTVVCYGTSVPGGSMMPVIALGALLGGIFGKICMVFLPLTSEQVHIFVMLGMAGFFTASLKAPITATVLVLEMMGGHTSLFMPLIIVSLVSNSVVELLKCKPIVKAILEDDILNSNYDMPILDKDDNKELIEVCVNMGAFLDGKKIKEVTWPYNCLIVGIRRGFEDIIPNGDTKIFAGDFIIALSEEENAHIIREQLEEIACKEIINV